MSLRDYFVAGVAVVLGLMSLLSALRVPLFGLDTAPYHLRSVKAVEAKFGRVGAQLLLFGIALLMFMTGAAIVAGSQSSVRSESGSSLENGRATRWQRFNH